MGTALVALTSDETDNQLLFAAKQYAMGTDTKLILCRFIDESQYQSKVQRNAESSTDTPSITDLEESAEKDAEGVAETTFSDEVPYITLSVVGDLPDDILRIAEQRSCDHIFITGKKRSPTGKVLFGDVAQSIILNFDGPVTVTTKSS